LVAARRPRELAGYFNYDRIIKAIDWNRVLLQAQAEHIRNHSPNDINVCGSCIESVLLRDREL